MFDRAAGWAQELPVLMPHDPTYGQWFGGSIAASGDTILVGAWADATVGYRAGAVYVFVRQGAGWVEQAKLTASDGMPMAFFGMHVALEGDVALITAPDDSNYVGAAYVFVRNGTTWTQQQKLVPAGEGYGAQVGWGAALRGHTIALGAPGAGNSSAGSVYVFEESGGVWSQTARLTAPDGVSGDNLGYSVGLDDESIVAGAPYTNGHAGTAYAFGRSGSDWAFQAEWTEPVPAGYDYFGMELTLSGGLAAVSAPWGNGGLGAVYLFRQSGGTWSGPEILAAADPGLNDAFGMNVSISDGTVAVASYAKPWPWFVGAAYVFERPNTPPTLACTAPPTLECSSAAGAPATVVAEVSDADGDPLTVTWSVDGAPVRTDSVPAGGPPTAAKLPLTVQLALGTHAFSATVSDGSASAACEATVAVVDTNPPQLGCPAGPALDGTSAAGAAVLYTAPQATDSCGPPSVVCAPPPGSTLPMGTTPITCTATDVAGLSSACTFAALVRGPQAILSAVRDELLTLASGLPPHGRCDDLEDAIEALGRASAPALWADGQRLAPRSGDRAIDRVAEAVESLAELVHQRGAPVRPDQLLAFEARSARAVRLLALVAIADGARGDPRPLARAKAELARGDEALLRNRPGAALDRFEAAWRHALAAVVR